MKQKVIIITGASSGIGLATAECLAKFENIVYSLSRSKPDSPSIKHIACDITNINAVKDAFELIYQKEGRIDALINNAGIGVSGAVEHSSQEELKKIIEINLIALIETSKIAVPYLRKTKGYLINISSVAGVIAIPFQSYYSLTKAAVLSFTKSLRLELAPFEIKTVAILPGDTKTSFTKNRTQPLVLENQLYGERIKRSLKKMEHDEENGVSPIIVANLIKKTLDKKNPPSTITVGFSYKLLVFLSKILPNYLVEKIIYQMYAK